MESIHAGEFGYLTKGIGYNEDLDKVKIEAGNNRPASILLGGEFSQFKLFFYVV